MVSRKKVERMMEKRLEHERKQILKEFKTTGKISCSFDDPSESDDSDDSLLHNAGLRKEQNDPASESDDSSVLEARSGNDPKEGKEEEIQVKQEEEMSLFQSESAKLGNYPPMDDSDMFLNQQPFAPPHFDLDTENAEISDLYDI